MPGMYRSFVATFVQNITGAPGNSYAVYENDPTLLVSRFHNSAPDSGSFSVLTGLTVTPKQVLLRVVATIDTVGPTDIYLTVGILSALSAVQSVTVTRTQLCSQPVDESVNLIVRPDGLGNLQFTSNFTGSGLLYSFSVYRVGFVL